ncbi:MAG: hypothetical protein JXQ75_23790 [Phycisphaerae bacterium]|nr:hypothetical protein [Phycisphaerae bacterium]
MENHHRFMIAIVAIAMATSAQNVADAQQARRSGDRAAGAAQPQPASPARTPAQQGQYLALGYQDEPLQEESTERYEERASGLEQGEDDVAARQSIDSFTSLEDGQPGDPGKFELEFMLEWETISGEHDPITLETELEYTPDGSDFLQNMQLILGVPVEMGLGGVDGNADLEFGWQQRWVREDGMMPTLATLAEIRIPSGYHSSGVDGTLTGIVAKDVGPGTAYLNGFVKTANGDNVEDVRHFQWGVVTGYKWRIDERFALIGDYVCKSSEEDGHANVNLLELSGEYKVNEHLTVGPGIVIGLDDNEETPNFGAGLRATISF